MRRSLQQCLTVLAYGSLLLAAEAIAASADSVPRQQAAEALRKAVGFFRDRVATEGGYLWCYSDDLARREGEGKATATSVWVQPPGTPSVGMAMLEAYHATGDKYYLEGACRAGECLVRGQLESGGWTYRIDFDPQSRKRYAYRADAKGKSAKARNVSTLDDDTTQAALRLLMRLDKELAFKDPKIHEAAEYALDRLMAVQYPNGAWPQGFERADPAEFPVKKAGYPDSWPRSHPGTAYGAYYTFNDNAMGDAIEVMFEAWRTYGRAKYRESAERAAEFILLAQMPEPQPAWAQQYDAQMRPASRKFEPPSITGGESQSVLRTLLAVYRETGDKKYLEPVPRAIGYLRRSQLPDGRLARFYELQSNRPLYFTTKYELTYRDDDLPTHYSFRVASGLDALERQYRDLAAHDPKELLASRAKPARPPRPSSRLAAQVRSAIAALDDQGRWVEEGTLRYHGKDDPTRRIISCRTFLRNVSVLIAYLATTR